MSLTVIDLSNLPVPDAIEALNFETLYSDYITRFKAEWLEARTANPSLPNYDVEVLETDPAAIIGQAWSFLRLLDRSRVNMAVRAVLAPLARGNDLDNVVARVNIERLVIQEAVDEVPAVMESDAQLLRRYFLAFDRPSAGSKDRYLYEAWTAWPGMLDAVVLGRDVHGRRGDVEIIVAGPGGAVPTTAQLALVRNAVNLPGVRPEATSVTVLAAVRATYGVDLTLVVPRGPDPSVIVTDASSRVNAAIANRLKIGAGVPVEAITGAAYGPNVIRVETTEPLIDIAPDPYSIPVATSISIAAEAE